MPNEAVKRARRNIAAMARNHSEDALKLFVSVMNDTELDEKLRMDAATHILDRAIGKPTQALSGDDDADALQVVHTIKRFIVDTSSDKSA